MTENAKELSAKELHLLEVAKKTEEAKNAALYDTYDYHKSEIDPQMKLFLARRCGRGHVRKKKPCQDFCMTVETEKSIILTAADGVSSCERSDVGSRLACEAVNAVVKSAEQHCKSEKEFVDLLCSMKFRKKVVTRWVNEVLKEASRLETSEETDQLQQLYQYGSTIMFVVITEHWYVSGNLGDGQILFFNDYDAVKVRAHLPKESSRVRALVNEKCYLEDFQMAVYPRDWFDGVLLSTDGMYDVLSPGINFHKYALQLKERFLTAGEPLQPFCYKEREEPLKDIFSYHTMDDCSVVMALDEKTLDISQFQTYQEAEAYSDKVLLDRKSQEVTVYNIMKNEEFRKLVVSKNEVSEIPELQSAVVLQAEQHWEKDGISYSVYQESPAQTLELLYSSGKLREQRERTINASLFTLEVYLKLLQCQQELKGHGLTLNESAHFLVRIHEETKEVFLMKEAISKMDENAEKKLIFWDYFAGMIGVLSCGEAKRPLFHPGYITCGRELFRIDHADQEYMCCVQNAGGMLKIKNLSEVEWLLENGETVKPQESIPLTDGMTIILPTDCPDYLVKYHYSAKESL